jgi:tRNA modification GTPase
LPGTIFALSSGRPPAAISVIRISGPDAHGAGRIIVGDLPDAREAAVRVLSDPTTKDRLDKALVLRFDGPASATGEDVVEFHCHGGRAVVDAVLSALNAIEGLREAVPGEFTRRAFENGRIDLTEAEGLADLLEAETEAQRRAALLLAEGGLRRQIESWQSRVLAVAARAELAIDYVGDDGGGEAEPIGAEARALAEELAGWLERPRSEALRKGIRVVAAGPPNAGKSSLINAITEKDRIIVSPRPGTTRDLIEIPLAVAGMPFVFVDTAGLRETSDEIEAAGVGLAEGAIAAADIVMWLGDPSAGPTHPRMIAIHSKSDIAGVAPQRSIAASAKTGDGLAALLNRLVREARYLLPHENEMALNRRQAAAIEEACAALKAASSTADPVFQAEELRQARSAFDRLSGRAGVEDMLDALFGRFCLGK